MSLSKRLINTGGALAAGPGFYGMRYTGDGSATYRNFTGFGFRPDIIWVKGNGSAMNPAISTPAGGFAQFVSPYSSNGYVAAASNAYPIDDGITVGGGDGANYNQNGTDYDVFAWKAGDSFVTNTNGTITSQVSANVANGISIVTWSGDAVNGRTIGHGLSSAPEMIIVKKTSGSSNWIIGGTAVGLSNYLTFQYYSQNISSDPTRFQQITDTTFQVGTNSDINGGASSYIAYCFHSVEGFSQIGQYAATSSGGTIPTSFAPKFFIGKSTNCSFPFYMKNKYMNNNLYQLTSNGASNTGPGLNLNADNFYHYLYFSNHLSCGNVFYATFGSDLM